MSFFYSTFGLSLASNRRLPGLIPQARSARIDTQITLGASPCTSADTAAAPWYISEELEDLLPTLRVWQLEERDSFRLLYRDGTEFIVDRDGTQVWATWPSASTLEDTATYLLGPVLGFVLRLRGVTCLHASAVMVGGRAIALMGPAGAGKSTTAAALGQRGYPVLTDDVVALSGGKSGVHAQPGYPQLRLWPDSVELLFGSQDALPPLTPTWDKRALDLTEPGQLFHDAPLPLAAIYLLDHEPGRPEGDAVAPAAEGRVEPVVGAGRLLALVGNTYVGYLLDTTMRRQEFATLAQLAADVPVRRVVAAAGRARTAQLCSSILRDCESL